LFLVDLVFCLAGFLLFVIAGLLWVLRYCHTSLFHAAFSGDWSLLVLFAALFFWTEVGFVAALCCCLCFFFVRLVFVFYFSQARFYVDVSVSICHCLSVLHGSDFSLCVYCVGAALVFFGVFISCSTLPTL